MKPSALKVDWQAGIVSLGRQDFFGSHAVIVDALWVEVASPMRQQFRSLLFGTVPARDAEPGCWSGFPINLPISGCRHLLGTEPIAMHQRAGD